MLCTIPALSNTRRCLVIACRVSLEPCVSREIEYGRRSQSLATNDKRVASPKAANTSACVGRFAAKLLWLLRDIVLDVLHLFSPAAIVSAECFKPAIIGKLIEAGLG
jgi:hypothetical protein